MLSSSLDILEFHCKLRKCFADIIFTSLACVLILSIDTDCLPGDWKLVRVMPIYKGAGSRSELCNYGPMSVICHIANIIEREVHAQFMYYLLLHNFITVDQSAYLQYHSRHTSLHKVVGDWLQYVHDREMVGIYMLDSR